MRRLCTSIASLLLLISSAGPALALPDACYWSEGDCVFGVSDVEGDLNVDYMSFYCGDGSYGGGYVPDGTWEYYCQGLF